jgi:hypothetical protein
MPARFEILCASATTEAATALLAGSLIRHLADLGIEGVSVRVGALDGRPVLDPDTVAGLSYSGVEPESLVTVAITPELLSGVELVLSLTTGEQEALLELSGGRCYTLFDYLGREGGAEELATPEAIHELARQAAMQIGYELETDPGRPGGMSRDVDE